MPNDDLVGPIDSSDEWIRQRTGIVDAHAAPASDVEAVDLAEAAAREAIAKAGIRPDQIGVVLVSHRSRNTVADPVDRRRCSPSASAPPRPPPTTSRAACAGYAYGIAQADSFIKSGLAEYVLVVGAEKLSDFVDPTDRSISFLLGDGAGAAVVGPSDIPGIAPTVWGSDGSKWDAIGMTATYNEYRDGAGAIAWPTLRQEGQTVFRWAVWEMVKVAQQALEPPGVTRRRPRRVRAAPGEHAHHRRVRQAAGAARDGRRSPATSRPPATPRPRASRSPRTACSRSTPSCRGGLALQIGFGAGLVFGAQVVVLP